MTYQTTNQSIEGRGPIGMAGDGDPAEVAAALGHALRASPEYEALARTGDLLQGDETATSAIEAFQRRQAELRMQLMLGTLTDDERRSLEELQAAVNELGTIRDYRVALADFQRVARETADVIGAAIEIDFAANCRAGGCCG